RPGARLRVLADVGLVEVDVRGLDGEAAALGHGITRVDGQVHDDLLELPRIGFHHPEIGRAPCHQADVLPNNPAQELVHVGHDNVEVQYLGLEHLFAAEGEKLASQRSRTLTRGYHLQQLGIAGIIRGQRVHDDLAEADDGGEQIVEVVRHAAGQD